MVERIIRKIVDDNVDIDKILVVTFTSAAASEMRERILEAIYKKIEQNPDDKNMYRQINLLNKASICTIDSFCLDVIKNNFFELDISANARVADGTEVAILKQETLEEIFEEKYIVNDEKFLKVIDTYTKYNKDEDLQNLILKIYNYIQTDPFPEEWLDSKVEMFKDVENVENFSDTKWGKIIIDYADNVLNNCILNLENLLESMNRFPELEKSIAVIKDDIENYKKLKTKLNNWDETASFIQNFKNKTWAADRKLEENLQQFVKDSKVIRDQVKDEYEKIKELIPYDTKSASADILFMYEILISLKEIILEFSQRFYKKKRERNIIDFNDMEHLALKILVKKEEDGSVKVTDVAKRYQEKFEEIAIDEYQDSNLVQELILTSVSKNNNIFMVGDVKQSIYKFRQARPELFLQKYDTYKLEPDSGEDRKIQLFKNFRSRQNVLDVTNMVFKNIMSKKLGNIEYNESEYLNLGANYENIENQNYTAELDIIDLKEDDDDIWKGSEADDTQEERVENIVLEARFVARKIRQLIDEKYQVIDKKLGKRDIEFKDIAVLLRSANAMAPIYEKEIASLGITVYSDSSEGYFQSTEVETIMSLLKIIDNPMQDIPLVTVMRSAIGNFTDNELIEISFAGNRESFYEKMLKTKDLDVNIDLKNKINDFLEKVENWREAEKYKPLDELIWQIYTQTGYMNYVELLPNGKLRVANLRLLFEKAKQYESASFKGLYNFITFIDKIKMSNGDTGAAKIIGENENVVRIMSIHKSKGLEFPVVIIAGTGKSFNFQDLNDKLLLHQDLGLGMQYIDSIRHIEFKTLPKKAISIMARQEIISEEMRVLYVALTRAKEKLIITGMQKDVNKILDEKSKALEIYGKDKDTINPFLVQKYKTYLDWLELVYAKEKMEDVLNLNIIKKSELLKDKSSDSKAEDIDIIEKINDEVCKNSDEEQKNKIKQIMNWKYKYSELNEIPTKTSVTKIKELANLNNKNEYSDNDDSYEVAEEKALRKVNAEFKPKFLNDVEEVKLTGAEKGTLMHLCVQKMNEKKDYNKDLIKEMIEELIEKEIITDKQEKNIDVAKLEKYTESDLWKELRKAKEIHKEQPFYINIPVNEIYKEDVGENENILVQGIIDLYFVDDKDNLVLIDYKTDFVKMDEESALVQKYEKQLELYKEALEQALKRKVDKVGIYSLYLNKFIEVKEVKKSEIR